MFRDEQLWCVPELRGLVPAYHCLLRKQNSFRGAKRGVSFQLAEPIRKLEACATGFFHSLGANLDYHHNTVVLLF